MDEQAVDITALVERLRAAGFRVDTRQYLAANELLLALAARGLQVDDDDDALASYLGPIFCTNYDEQRRFASHVREWRRQTPQQRRPPETEDVTPVRLSRLRYALTTAGLLGFALVVAVLLYAYLESRTGIVEQPGGPNQVARPPAKGPGSDPPGQADPGKRVMAPGWTAVAISSAFGFLVFVGFHRLFVRNMRRLVLKRLETLGDAEHITLQPEVLPAIAKGERELGRIASELRRPHEQEALELSMTASVHATLRAGGIFTPVYSARRASPEYLVLMQRRSAHDHWSLWVDELARALTSNEVALDRFTFHDDPRTCYADTEKREPRQLKDLVSHHHRATLFLFAESSVFFDRSGNEPAAWLAEFRTLKRRVLFVPEPPFRWGRREWALSEEGFIVLPAGPDGLDQWSRLTADWRIEQMLPAPYARPYPVILADSRSGWLGRNGPPATLVNRLVEELRGYLGPAPFRWLCACAVYPEISWPLTLHLAAARGESPEEDRTSVLDALPALSRLPWFRYGYMPDWLRRVLILQLPQTQRATIRLQLEALLHRLVAESPTAPKTRAPAAQSNTELKISRWLRPADVMDAAPPGSPLRDAVFLGFMRGGRLDALALEVGVVFRRLFGRDLDELPKDPVGDDAISRPQRSGTRRRRVLVIAGGVVIALIGLIVVSLGLYVGPIPPAPPPVSPVPRPPTEEPGMKTLNVERKIELQGMPERAQLTPDNIKELDIFLNDIKPMKISAIVVTGHTDRLGTAASANTPAAKQKRSEEQALVVYNYILSKGLDKTIVSWQGKADEQPIPITKFCSERMKPKQLSECLAVNRRTTVEAVGTQVLPVKPSIPASK